MPATRLVYVADREADILALRVRARDLERSADWLIRSQHNRALPDGERLWHRVTAGEPPGKISFTQAARQGQEARELRQRIWAQRFEWPDAARGVVSATCIVARESAPPPGVKPMESRVLSKREVADFEAAVQLIDWYPRVGR